MPSMRVAAEIDMTQLRELGRSIPLSRFRHLV